MSPLANCLPWMFWWQSSHWLGAALKSTFSNLVSRLGGLWQSMQAVAPCAPSKANFVFEWSKPESSFHDFVVWHASHPAGEPSARACCMRALNWPWCGSLWQLVQLRVFQWYFAVGVGWNSAD